MGKDKKDKETQATAEESGKKKSKGKTALIILGVIVFVGFVNSLIGTPDNQTGSDSSTVSTLADSQTVEETSAPVISTAEIEAIETSAETTLSDEDTHLMVQNLLESSVLQSFEHHTVSYSEDIGGYVISVWQDGLSESAYLVAEGGDKSSWEIMRESIKNTSSSIRNVVVELDADAHVLMQVLNDLNLENTLLTALDGVVTYDAYA